MRQCEHRCTTSASTSARHRAHLKAPKRTHNKRTGDKPFTCDECNYKCSRSSHLERHKRRHTGEKPYECEECDWRCTQSGNLEIHKRTHTGEKPYECDECGFRCTTSGWLKTHKRTHTGEKPYTCDECDYKSSQSSHLQSHKRTHTGEKPYACDECEFRCSQLGSFDRHKQRHHSRLRVSAKIQASYPQDRRAQASLCIAGLLRGLGNTAFQAFLRSPSPSFRPELSLLNHDDIAAFLREAETASNALTALLRERVETETQPEYSLAEVVFGWEAAVVALKRDRLERARQELEPPEHSSVGSQLLPGEPEEEFKEGERPSRLIRRHVEPAVEQLGSSASTAASHSSDSDWDVVDEDESRDAEDSDWEDDESRGAKRQRKL